MNTMILNGIRSEYLKPNDFIWIISVRLEYLKPNNCVQIICIENMYLEIWLFTNYKHH